MYSLTLVDFFDIEKTTIIPSIKPSYIEKDPSIEGDDVPVGYLLQTLWSTFQEEDREGWINIQVSLFCLQSWGGAFYLRTLRLQIRIPEGGSGLQGGVPGTW